IEGLHRLPGDMPQRDTNLEHGELITGIEVPHSDFSRNYFYLKIRDRASYAFALVSVAAALDMQGGKIGKARIALGGVAHKPWRALAAERMLAGARLDAEVLRPAAEAALKEAKPRKENAFKVELAKRAIVRAVLAAGGVA